MTDDETAFHGVIERASRVAVRTFLVVLLFAVLTPVLWLSGLGGFSLLVPVLVVVPSAVSSLVSDWRARMVRVPDEVPEEWL